MFQRLVTEFNDKFCYLCMYSHHCHLYIGHHHFINKILKKFQKVFCLLFITCTSNQYFLPLPASHVLTQYSHIISWSFFTTAIPHLITDFPYECYFGVLSFISRVSSHLRKQMPFQTYFATPLHTSFLYTCISSSPHRQAVQCLLRVFFWK